MSDRSQMSDSRTGLGLTSPRRFCFRREPLKKLQSLAPSLPLIGSSRPRPIPLSIRPTPSYPQPLTQRPHSSQSPISQPISFHPTFRPTTSSTISRSTTSPPPHSSHSARLVGHGKTSRNRTQRWKGKRRRGTSSSDLDEPFSQRQWVGLEEGEKGHCPER